MTQQASYFPLGGGMDLVTPAVAIAPGRAVAALNYEPVASGYRRLRGYERFDGRPAPSEGNYWVIHFSAGGTPGEAIVAGDQIDAVETGSLPVLATMPAVILSGSFAGGNAVGYIVVIGVINPSVIAVGNTLRVNSTQFATATSAFVPNEAVPGATSQAATTAIATALRSQITSVFGEGPIRGVWFHEGTVFAFRNDVGGASGNVRRSNNGWDLVNFSTSFTFNSGGTNELAVGLLVNGATSAAQGYIKAISVTSGSWAGGDAAGTVSIWVSSGTFQSGENIEQGLSGTNDATLTNAGTLYAAPAGGSYEFITHNFYGSSDLARVYMVNGVGPALEFDPVAVSLAPISTGMSPDTPNHIAAHKGSLFLSFPGGSVQFSTVGNPLSFNAVTGAGELGIGSDVTGFIEANGALAIFGENSINVLYGSDSADYQLEVLTHEAGALPHTMQRIGQIVYMDNRGLRSLAASQAYGNFSMGTLSRLVQPLLEDKRRDGIQPAASMICRTADQYWLFFDDGTGIIANFSGKQPAILPFDLGKTVTAAASVEDDGEERLFIGCDDGFVYELNRGTSFDGDEIEHYLRLPFNHFGAPQLRKRLHQVAVDLEASGTTTLGVSVEFDYGSVEGPTHQILAVTTGGGAIDSLGSNELYFASQIETVASAYMDGVFKNASLKIGGDTDDEEPHTLTGVTFYISPRGLQR